MNSDNISHNSIFRGLFCKIAFCLVLNNKKILGLMARAESDGLSRLPQYAAALNCIGRGVGGYCYFYVTVEK